MSVFDKRAGEWEKKPRRLKLATDVVECIIKNARPQKNICIADFGTGTGLILLGLAEYASDMTGYDSSAGMLEVLVNKAKDAGIPNLSTVFFDLDKDSFPEEAYHLMTCSMVAHHLENPADFFCKAYKSLKKGGQLCVADLEISDEPFHDEPNAGVLHEGFDTKTVQEQMTACGFCEVNIYPAAQMEKERDGRKIMFNIFLAVGKK
jgi:ubiquinone/menaquinone biosynthesis C-methylase UbiE